MENTPVEKKAYLEKHTLTHSKFVQFAQFVTHALLLPVWRISLYETKYSVFSGVKQERQQKR